LVLGGGDGEACVKPALLGRIQQFRHGKQADEHRQGGKAAKSPLSKGEAHGGVDGPMPTDGEHEAQNAGNSPLTMEPLARVEIMVREKKATAKYSKKPKLVASLAREGAMKTSAGC
jgi:hypothetical protein